MIAPAIGTGRLGLVIDSSIVLAWHFPDEASEYARAAAAETAVSRTLVPFHWKLETANALTMGVRRNRINSADRAQAFIDIDDLEIVQDTQGLNRIWPFAIEIADRNRLTLYDALYVELAQRIGSRLATLDKAMKAAAVAEGVPLFEPMP